jgi:hypothetical protein
MHDTDTMVSFAAADMVMQDEVWRGSDGWVRVDDMSVRRRRALLAWLRRHADGLHDARMAELALSRGVEAERAYGRMVALGPAVWLEETPLVRRLARTTRRISWPGRGLLRRRRWRQ